jgi:hypothetical protein
MELIKNFIVISNEVIILNAIKKLLVVLIFISFIIMNGSWVENKSLLHREKPRINSESNLYEALQTRDSNNLAETLKPLKEDNTYAVIDPMIQIPVNSQIDPKMLIPGNPQIDLGIMNKPANR